MNIANFNFPVADNIERIIKERGLKQCAVASKAGFKKQPFSDMLNGRRLIKTSDVIIIAKALGVSINELYDSTGLKSGYHYKTNTLDLRDSLKLLILHKSVLTLKPKRILVLSQDT